MFYTENYLKAITRQRNLKYKRRADIGRERGRKKERDRERVRESNVKPDAIVTVLKAMH